MNESPEPFVHWCEVCGVEELLTSVEAFRVGWDFPPGSGSGSGSGASSVRGPVTSTR